MTQPEREALKPCPFCGEPPDYLEWVSCLVRCEGCGAHGPVKPDAKAAIEAWNTRALSPPTPASGEPTPISVECDCTTSISPTGGKRTFCSSKQMERAVAAGQAFQGEPTDEREAFEAWALTNPHDVLIGVNRASELQAKDDNAEYSNIRTELAWRAWKTRAALSHSDAGEQPVALRSLWASVLSEANAIANGRGIGDLTTAILRYASAAVTGADEGRGLYVWATDDPGEGSILLQRIAGAGDQPREPTAESINDSAHDRMIEAADEQRRKRT